MTAPLLPFPDSRPVLDPLKVPLDKRVLIEASAGTGKTFTITRLYLRLLLEQHAPAADSNNMHSVRSILTVTFTEAATAELKSRIYAMLKNALLFLNSPKEACDDDGFLTALLDRMAPEKARLALMAALNEFDSAAIYTIHGFCRRVLCEFAFESNALFASELITDQSGFIQEAARDFWRANLYQASPLFISYLANKGCKGPESLLRLFGAARGIHEFKIVPQDPSDPDTQERERQTLVLLDHVKNLWRLHQDEVTGLFSSPDLKKNIYSSAMIRKMVAAMNQLAWSAFPDSSANELLFKWTPASLDKSVKKGGTAPTHPFFTECDRLYRSLNMLYQLFDRKFVFLKASFLHQVRSRLEQEKERHNLVGFDDLLLKVYRGLRNDNTHDKLIHVLRNRYSAALIDEFQDTDPLQYDIFSFIFFKSAPLFLIGDPKQAIYRFRGADIFTYFKACQDIDLQYTLLTNFRSCVELVHAINHLFTTHANPFVSDRISCSVVRPARETETGSAQPRFVLWTLLEDESKPIPFPLATTKIMNAIAAEIKRLCGPGDTSITGAPPLLPSSIAVLVRTNNEAVQAHAALTSAGIPSTLHMTGSVFDTYEAFELELVLSALLFPLSRPAPFKTALATSLFGLTFAEIDRLNSDDKEWDKWQAMACAYQEEWRDHGVLALLRTVITTERTRARIVARPGGERTLTNLLHLSELLHKKSMASPCTMAALVQWLAHKRRSAQTDTAPDEEMIRLETDDEAVTISTIHKSKGLEYPIVFCPFNWRSSGLGPGKGRQPFVFHNPEYEFAPTLALDSDAMDRFRPAAQEEALAENMRLLYVALTRARDRCYCVWSNGKSADISGLSWLLFGASRGTPCSELLIQRMGSLAANDCSREIGKRIKGAEQYIACAPLPSVHTPPVTPAPKRLQKLSCRIFDAVIPAPHSILSYSSIAHLSRAAPVEQDHDFSAVVSIATPADSGIDYSTITAFPHGARAGSFFHELFEAIDFTAPEPVLASLSVRLQAYGFDQRWEKTVSACIRATLALELDPALQLRLNAIPYDKCLKELEFHFPITAFSYRDILSLVNETASVSDNCMPLAVHTPHGHMKGFIDLVFTWNDRFYIIDWKSNTLGTTPNAYHPESLASVMREEHYLLQYHLYTVALHHYLKLRKPGYSYDNHFGGVYYLFLRGISSRAGSRSGVYFDRPNSETIKELCSLLNGTTP